MSDKKYTDEELKELKDQINQVTADLKKSFEASSSKEESAKPEESKAPEASASASGSKEGFPPEASGSEDSKGSDMGPASGSEAPVAPGQPEAAPEQPAPDAGVSDVATLVSAYSQLSPEDLQNHQVALQQVMASKQPPAPPVAAPGAPAPAPAAPMAPPAAPAPAPAAPMAPPAQPPVDPTLAMKSMKEETEVELKKSESRIDELEKTVATLVETIKLTLKKSERKSVTGEDLFKSQPAPKAIEFDKLSKSELTAELNKIAKDPNLTKSERALINSFYSKEVKQADLKPLFEKK